LPYYNFSLCERCVKKIFLHFSDLPLPSFGPQNTGERNNERPLPSIPSPFSRSKNAQQNRVKKPSLTSQVRVLAKEGDACDCLLALANVQNFLLVSVTKRVVLALLERAAGAKALADASCAGGEEFFTKSEPLSHLRAGAKYLQYIDIDSFMNVSTFLMLLDRLEVAAGNADNISKKLESEEHIDVALMAFKCLLMVRILMHSHGKMRSKILFLNLFLLSIASLKFLNNFYYLSSKFEHICDEGA